jgi:hypothetical protein
MGAPGGSWRACPARPSAKHEPAGRAACERPLGHGGPEPGGRPVRGGPSDAATTMASSQTSVVWLDLTVTSARPRAPPSSAGRSTATARSAARSITTAPLASRLRPRPRLALLRLRRVRVDLRPRRATLVIRPIWGRRSAVARTGVRRGSGALGSDLRRERRRVVHAAARSATPLIMAGLVDEYRLSSAPSCIPKRHHMLALRTSLMFALPRAE